MGDTEAFRAVEIRDKESPGRVICREQQGCLVIEIHGRHLHAPFQSELGLDGYIAQAAGMPYDVLREDRRPIIVDLRHLAWLNSAALGGLLRLYVSRREQNTPIIFCQATERVRSVLTTTKLISLEGFYVETLAEAILRFTTSLIDGGKPASS